MMVSTKGRYALRVMLDLALHSDEAFVSLKAICARQGVSFKYLETIVSLLHKGKLVESSRGKEGGYRLARPAEQITVSEVLRLTEGSIAPVACLSDGGNGCDRAENCLTLPMWKQLNQLIETYLSGVTLASLCEDPAKNQEKD